MRCLRVERVANVGSRRRAVLLPRATVRCAGAIRELWVVQSRLREAAPCARSIVHASGLGRPCATLRMRSTPSRLHPLHASAPARKLVDKVQARAPGSAARELHIPPTRYPTTMQRVPYREPGFVWRQPEHLVGNARRVMGVAWRWQGVRSYARF